MKTGDVLNGFEVVELYGQQAVRKVAERRPLTQGYGKVVRGEFGGWVIRRRSGLTGRNYPTQAEAQAVLDHINRATERGDRARAVTRS